MITVYIYNIYIYTHAYTYIYILYITVYNDAWLAKFWTRSTDKIHEIATNFPRPNTCSSAMFCQVDATASRQAGSKPKKPMLHAFHCTHVCRIQTIQMIKMTRIKEMIQMNQIVKGSQ